MLSEIALLQGKYCDIGRNGASSTINPRRLHTPGKPAWTTGPIVLTAWLLLRTLAPELRHVTSMGAHSVPKRMGLASMGDRWCFFTIISMAALKTATTS